MKKIIVCLALAQYVMFVLGGCLTSAPKDTIITVDCRGEEIDSTKRIDSNTRASYHSCGDSAVVIP